ncbi:MAG: ADP-ribosylglycohydrolase family protein [Synergistaceae bacterium]|nr:ADP-ribosylglycohydrolase family protein [Synergistaceae bacterium]
MLGAIAGDIIGSPYEFNRNNIKTTDFPLFSERSRFTDDTVMTFAIADAILKTIPERGMIPDENVFAEAVIDSMHELGHAYPHAGYGSKFVLWLAHYQRTPYGSCGNGSAMRVSPVAWAFDDIETAEKFAGLSAMVSHNHPEGIKGAQATASAIFLANAGNTKAQICEYISEKYGYDLTRTLDEIRSGYKFDATCQGSVPEAITAFLESTGYEDAVRKAVSIGGDSDTIACIAGGIAEAFYGGVPEETAREVIIRLDGRLQDLLERWYTWLAGGDE